MLDVQTLTDIAKSLRLERVTGSGPASLLKVCFLENLRLVDTLAGALDLTFLTKGVVLSDSLVEPTLAKDLLDPKVTKALPLIGGSSLIPGVLDPPATGEGGGLGDAAGMLGRIQGTLPIPIDVPIAADTQVVLQKPGGGAGSAMDTAMFRVDRDGPSEFCVTIQPEFRELTTEVPVSTEEYELVVSVLLRVGSVATPYIPLPPIMLTLPIIPIPTIFVLFEHVDFQGKALVMVPSNSPLGSLTVLNETLANVEQLLQTASTVLDAAGLLLPLGLLKGLLAARPGATFIHSDAVDQLDAYVLTPHWYKDTKWDDEVSSLDRKSVV